MSDRKSSVSAGIRRLRGRPVDPPRPGAAVGQPLRGTSMRWCRDRWRGRAALLMLIGAVAAPAAAQVTSSTPAAPEARIKEIEDAGEKLLKGQVDDSLKDLEAAVR